MNFFQAKSRAKKSSKRLLLIYFLLLFLLSFVIVLGVSPFLSDFTSMGYAFGYSKERFMNTYILVAPVIILLVTVSSFIKWSSFRSSGGVIIAESLGGKLIPPNSMDLQERKILNVVEEMAIASGVSVPPVFLLEDNTINAFAAGFTKDDAVIGITKGAISNLTREELQGVIAHEFSHIFHGDMRLNMQLASLIFGLYILSVIGEGIVRIAGTFKPSSSKESGASVSAIIAIAGVVFLIVGWLGQFFGHIFQAAISRQREFLADATAVQYTRNPLSIGNALKKIGGLYGSSVRSENVKEFSHAFFANAESSFISKIYATHPPLEERIKRVDKNWDGKYIINSQTKPKNKTRETTSSATAQKVNENRNKERFLAVLTAAIKGTDTITQEQIIQARKSIDGVTEKIKDEISTPLGAVVTTFALLADKNIEIRNLQWEKLQEHYPQSIYEEAIYIYNLIEGISNDQKILIVELAMPSLKMLSSLQYKKYKEVMDAFIQADNRIDPIEWMIQLVVINELEHALNLKRLPKTSKRLLKEVTQEISYLLSVSSQINNKLEAEKVFNAANQKLFASKLSYKKIENDIFENMKKAVDKLLLLDLEHRRIILHAVVDMAEYDGKITEDEFSFIKIVGITLGIAVPLN